MNVKKPVEKCQCGSTELERAYAPNKIMYTCKKCARYYVYDEGKNGKSV